MDATVALPGSGVLETIARSIGPVPGVHLRDTASGEALGPIIVPRASGGDAPHRYRIDGEIGRGGMGAVLKGRDPDLGRDVALKVLREDFGSDPVMVRRFIEEAQIGGQLQHPGVVPIYELGMLADRRPFFAMKLVKGHTLAVLLADREGPDAGLPRFLAVFEAVCQTMAYAHARGVIHRDLKPSNVMVGSFGEVQVMDWGLAKVLPREGTPEDGAPALDRHETIIATARTGEPDSDRSSAGSVLGTPAYMAPEQARGEVGAIDERVDVFALGSMLCEILTGIPAFTGRSAGEIQRKAALGDLEEARTRLESCGADAALIALAGDCLAREREDRPRDAAAVADRVTAYLSDVQRRLRAAELASIEERARRRLTTVLAAGMLVVSVGGGAGFTYWSQQRQAREARAALGLKEATILKDRAEASRSDLDLWRLLVQSIARVEPAALGAEDRERYAAMKLESNKRLQEAIHFHQLEGGLVDVRACESELDPEAVDHYYGIVFGAADVRIDSMELEDARSTGTVDLSGFVGQAELIAWPGIAAYLDDWAALRRRSRPKSGNWRRASKAARIADPDADRDRIRRALVADDAGERLTELRRIAASADTAWWAPASLILLAESLADAGDVGAGIALLERGYAPSPGDAALHFALGRLYEQSAPPRADDALRAFAVARALRPELAGHALAHALERANRDDEAGLVWRDLIGRRPNNGFHLRCYAAFLERRGLVAEAAETFRKAGSRLSLWRHTDASIAAYRNAIRLRPDDAEGHLFLGRLLVQAGELSEALKEKRLGHEMGSTRPGWTHRSSGDEVRQLERLEAVLADRATPASPDEATRFAELAYYSKRYAAATRLFTAAFSEEPGLETQRSPSQRYNAACCAALAGTGQGRDAPAAAAPQAEMRARALGWLRAELAYWLKDFESDPRSNGWEVGLVLYHWEEDPDLAGVRDPEALMKLPESERGAWRALWEEVSRLLQRRNALFKPSR